MMTYADEGMWLFNDPPRALLKERYNFDITDQWLEHVQKASVRFNSGGSGSFVSDDGLVMSNHHVGADALQKLASEKNNYVRDGYYARTLEEEIKCVDLELNVLVSIEDVTDRVKTALKPGMTGAEAFAVRRAIMADIEKESLEKTGLRSDVITLFQGAKDHLYRYKKYTDVRLVFAPEEQAAKFGGDPDNFEFPRFSLDFCFFRAYENGKPARIDHYLKWNEKGPAENELVFMTGHPGRTSRLMTTAELEYLRDVQLPYTLDYLNAGEVALTAFSARSAENARRAKDELYSIMNGRKGRLGAYETLLNPDVMQRKRAAEEKLKQGKTKDAYDRIATAQKVIRQNALKLNLLENHHGLASRSFSIARTLVRAAAERGKPSGDRLREFRDSNRESLELQLFSEEPLYDDFEQAQLAHSLTFLARKLGFNDPLVQKILAGKAPTERAAQLIKGTRVKDVKHRRDLYEKDLQFFAKSDDPMIQLALLVDDEARAVRKIVEAQDEIKRQAHEEIAAARNASLGTAGYPDATFTLRLAFGRTAGYEDHGEKIPYQTTFAGMFQRAESHRFQPPYDLPKSWLAAREKLDMTTPFNYVATTDSIGGNSGSPMINRAGEIIGINFDRNLHGLGRDFFYTDEKARNIAVHTRAITESLRKVYGAEALADKLTARK
jgi:hypothetical protein